MTKIHNLQHVPIEKGSYIAGFVDGEGSFWVTARPRTDYPTGWKFSPSFHVGNCDIVVLEICKKYLGCGKLRESRPGFYVLEVADREVLKSFLIPFFKKFSFLSTKKKTEFRVFQTLLTRLAQGVQTHSDLEELLALRKELGLYRKQRSKHTDEMIRATFKSKESSETIR
jgi:LAGLIDADG endonuclease